MTKPCHKLLKFLYMSPNGGFYAVADIDNHITKVAGQMGRLGHDGREGSDCARSREVWWPERKK